MSFRIHPFHPLLRCLTCVNKWSRIIKRHRADRLKWSSFPLKGFSLFIHYHFQWLLRFQLFCSLLPDPTRPFFAIVEMQSHNPGALTPSFPEVSHASRLPFVSAAALMSNWMLRQELSGLCFVSRRRVLPED